MSQTDHSEPFQCGDTSALVTYLYDECEMGERAAIAAHVSACVACAEELASLGETRTQLSAWTPPQVNLGFQIAREQREETESQPESAHAQTRVAPAPLAFRRPAALVGPTASSPTDRDALRGGEGRWWTRPLPAWAQVAAAALIFASGMAIGAARQGAVSGAAGSTASAAVPVSAAPVSVADNAVAGSTVPVNGVSRRDLDMLEQRLRSEMSHARTVAAPAVPSRGDSGEVLRRVETLIAESEQRQRQELALRTAEVMRDIDTQRRVDLAQVQRTVGQIQDITGAAVRDQNDMFNYLVKVSTQRR